MPYLHPEEEEEYSQQQQFKGMFEKSIVESGFLSLSLSNPHKGWDQLLCGRLPWTEFVIKKDSYSSPYLRDFANHLHGLTILSPISTNVRSISKITIVTSFRAFQYLRMYFRLQRNSKFPTLFNQGYSRIGTFLFCFLDDLFLANANAEEH